MLESDHQAPAQRRWDGAGPGLKSVKPLRRAASALTERHQPLLAGCFTGLAETFRDLWDLPAIFLCKR
jgi:hypothetical protein